MNTFFRMSALSFALLIPVLGQASCALMDSVKDDISAMEFVSCDSGKCLSITKVDNRSVVQKMEGSRCETTLAQTCTFTTKDYIIDVFYNCNGGVCQGVKYAKIMNKKTFEYTARCDSI